MTCGNGIMGASFSSKDELLDKDTHAPEKPEEGRVTAMPGLFLFRLQMSKALGIPHPANLTLRMTLDQHSTYIYVLMSTNSEQLALLHYLL